MATGEAQTGYGWALTGMEAMVGASIGTLAPFLNNRIWRSTSGRSIGLITGLETVLTV
jgi:hypothetical protein